MSTSASPADSVLSQDVENHLSRTIMKLAWPAILEQFLICMATLTDTAMVGSIGAVATASVAVNISTVWMINGFITALSVGFSFLISHSVGEGNQEKTRSLTYQSITLSVCLGAMLTLAVQLICHPLPIWLGAAPEVIPCAQTYMQIVSLGLIPQTLSVVLSAIFRSAGNTRIPLAANLTSNAANIIGNFFLIYPARTVTFGTTPVPVWGAGLGTAGAAAATAGSQLLLMIILLAFLAYRETPVKISLLENCYRVQKPVLAQIWKISIPVFLERFTLTSGQVALTAMISTLGTVPLAAHYLTNQAEGLLYLPAYGFAYTATALVGQALGAGRGDLADKFASHICLIGSAVIVLACIPVALWSGAIMGLFSSDPDVVSLGTRTLFIASTTEIFFSFFVIAGGICRGSGDVRFTLVISIIGMWGLRIGLVYLATRPLQMGVVGVWLAIAADCFIRMVLCVWRLKSGKWKEHSV